MNNKTKGALAGIAGVALLAGGSTFALWSDSEAVAGGQITAGNLDVALVPLAEGTEGLLWQDVSPDRSDFAETLPYAGHRIDLADYRIIPGDAIVGGIGVAAALEGENMVAELSITEDGDLPSGELLDQVDLYYSVVSADGGTVLVEEAPIDEITSLPFASADNGNKDGLTTLPASIPADPAGLEDAQFVVLIGAHFKNLGEGQSLDYTTLTADLGTLGVTLEQTRDQDAPGFQAPVVDLS